MSIETIIDNTIGKEGRYSFHGADLGGETMWGITAATARANGYKGPMKGLPRETAKAIYLNEYFLKPKFDLIHNVSPAIAEELFDSSVNMGSAKVKPWLQQALNLLSNQGKDYAKIAEDGKYGPATVAALKSFLAKRGALGEKVLLKLLNIMQGARYIEISIARPANQAFLFGWLANRVEL